MAKKHKKHKSGSDRKFSSSLRNIDIDTKVPLTLSVKTDLSPNLWRANSELKLESGTPKNIESPILGGGYAKHFERLRVDSTREDTPNYVVTPPFKPTRAYLQARDELIKTEPGTHILPSNLNPASIEASKAWDEALDFLASVWVDDIDADDTSENTPTTFWEYCLLDIGLGSEDTDIDNSMPVRDELLNFLRVPIQVEYLMFFGFFACCDALLFVIVYLPLRVIWAVFLLINHMIPFDRLKFTELKFHRTQLYDLVRIFTIVIGTWVLFQFHMSRIYHYVRGQAFIKLYVIFNMLDIFDRLMCSIGQDIVESLWFNTRTAPRAFYRISLRTVICTIYVSVHSFLYFVRLVTLNAAINSESNALLTILISNNFVELKGSVFKRFAEQNLFQITCADIVERFELFVFILLTSLQRTESWADFLYGSVGYIVICELVVDWVKHAFITKFNKLRPTCYHNFLEALCRDFVPTRVHKALQSSVDPTQPVSQRIGLATLPLTCVVLRMLLSMRTSSGDIVIMSKNGTITVLLTVMCAVLTKSLLNICLRGFACRTIISHESLIVKAARQRKVNGNTSANLQTDDDVRKKHQREIDKLSEIKRYQIYKSRLPT